MATYKLTPDTGEVSGGPHSDMPLVLIPSDTEIGSINQAEADSIRVYEDAALTTEVPREIVSDDEIHFKGSSVSSSSEYWVDYDGQRSDYTDTDTYGAENVWGSYVLVVHFNGLADSTGTYSFTTDGSPTEVSGNIGRAYDFDDNESVIRQGINTVPLDSDYTILAWINPDNLSGNPFIMHETSGIGRLFFQLNNNGNDELGFSDGGGTNQFSNSSVPTGIWTHCVGVRNLSGGTNRLLFNSSQEDSGAAGNSSANQHNYHIADRFSDDKAYNGKISEVRVYNGVLSNDWITTEYNNQNDNAAFWVASEVQTDTPGSIGERNSSGVGIRTSDAIGKTD